MSNIQSSIRLLLAAVALVVLPTTYAVSQTVAIRGATVHTASDAGTIENATILIRDGRFESVGTDVDIPISAQVIEANGSHIIPGVVDPYYSVGTTRASGGSAVRTIVFRGRTFTIGGGGPSNNTSLIRIAEVLDSQDFEWDEAIRSGITTLNLVTDGYCQTAVARPLSGTADEVYLVRNGTLHGAATNETKSLNVIRGGMTEPKKKADGKQIAGSKKPSQKSDDADDDEPPTLSENSESSTEVWAKIRAGELPLLVNANNAAAVLHVNKIQESSPKAKIVYTLSGSNAYNSLKNFDPKTHSLIVGPRIDTEPNSQTRINIAHLLAEKQIPFALSLSLSKSQLRDNQDTPLFPLAILCRAGLSTDAALQSITLNAAKILGIDSVVGSIEPGKYANFIVLDNDPLGTYTQIEQVFLEGSELPMTQRR